MNLAKYLRNNHFENVDKVVILTLLPRRVYIPT